MRHHSNIGLGPGREFDLVRTMLTRWGTAASGIGDDAAIVDIPAGEQLVVSTDASIENVHFRREWLSPEEIAYRATMAALSDVAAMAAAPRGLLVALTIPERWVADLAALADGIGAAARAADCPILGGDITRGHGGRPEHGDRDTQRRTASHVSTENRTVRHSRRRTNAVGERCQVRNPALGNRECEE